MWYRIEAFKDGSISSCEEVSESFKNSKHVCYVEASSKAEAISIFASKWDRHLARKRHYNTSTRTRNQEKGLCLCGKELTPDRSSCASCLASACARNKNYRDRIRRGEEIGNRHAKSASEKAEKHSSRRKRQHTIKAAITARFGSAGNYTRYLNMRRILDRFEKDPASALAWLREQVRAAEAGEWAREPVASAAE